MATLPHPHHVQSVWQLLMGWQSLLGALIGASTPIVAWIIRESRSRAQKKKDNLFRLDRILAYQINAVVQVHNNVKSFVDERLKQVVNSIEQKTKMKQGSLDNAFFPLLEATPVDDRIMDLDTGSVFLANMAAQALLQSRSFSASVDDSRRQFEHTLTLHKEMVLSKLNPPDKQNENYKRNVESYRVFIREELLERNVATYLLFLAYARQAVEVIRKNGIKKWHQMHKGRTHEQIKETLTAGAQEMLNQYKSELA